MDDEDCCANDIDEKRAYNFLEVVENEDYGQENLGAADEDEMSLGNFYTDLEKQPRLTKYSSMSQGDQNERQQKHDNASSAKPLRQTASGSQKTDSMSIQTANC